VCAKVPIATLKSLIMNANTVLIGRAKVRLRCMKRINASAPALAGGPAAVGNPGHGRNPDKNSCSHGVGRWVVGEKCNAHLFLFFSFISSEDYPNDVCAAGLRLPPLVLYFVLKKCRDVIYPSR
jgi:hypothetical protein